MTTDQSTLSEAELKEIVLGIDLSESPPDEGVDSLKKTLSHLSLQTQIVENKRPFLSISYDLIIAFAVGLILALALAFPWILHKTARFEARVEHLSRQIDDLLQILKQYEGPLHPTPQEIIEPLLSPSKFDSAT